MDQNRRFHSLRTLRSLRKVRTLRKMRNFAANHFNYLSFTSLIIFGVIEVLGGGTDPPQTLKIIQNHSKSLLFENRLSTGTTVGHRHNFSKSSFSRCFFRDLRSLKRMQNQFF